MEKDNPKLASDVDKISLRKQNDKKRQCPFPNILEDKKKTKTQQFKKKKDLSFQDNSYQSNSEEIEEDKSDEDYQEQNLSESNYDDESSSEQVNDSNSLLEDKPKKKRLSRSKQKQTNQNLGDELCNQSKILKKQRGNSKKNQQMDIENEQRKGNKQIQKDDYSQSDQEDSNENDENSLKKKQQNKQKDIKETRPKQILANSIQELIEQIQKYTKHQFQGVVDEHNQIIENVQNVGGNPGTMIEMYRNGEYKGLGLMILEYTRPLLTDLRIIKALQFIQQENLQQAMKILCIEKEVIESSLDLIYQVIIAWLLNQQFGLPPELKGKQQAVNLNDEKYSLLKQYIYLEKHSAIKSAVKVTSVGLSKKGHPVVPESWLDRDFSNCDELHNEMNKLDWRLGKPPITYCATYGAMNIVKQNEWINKDRLNILQLKNVSAVVYLKMQKEKQDFKIKSYVQEISNQEDLKSFISLLPSDVDIINNLNRKDSNQGSILFAMKKSDFFEQDPVYETTLESVGTLVSRMQKAVRRGKKGPNSLLQSLQSLSHAPPYNLPDQQFIRVSASRQILWRSFIICVEDSQVFIGFDLGLLELVLLSILTSMDPNLQLNKVILEKIYLLMLEIQSRDGVNVCIPWRTITSNFIQKQSQLILINKAQNHQNNQDKNHEKILKEYFKLQNAFKIALRFQTMMQGDQEMLSKCLALLQKNIKIDNVTDLSQQLAKINVLNLQVQKDIKNYLYNSDPSVERDIVAASFDMHCMPNIILTLQGSLPFLPSKQVTTKEISKFIWDYSSSYNIRYSHEKIPQNQYDIQTLETLKEIQKNLIQNKNFFNEDKQDQHQIQKNSNQEDAQHYQEVFKDFFQNINQQQIIYKSQVLHIDKITSKLAFLKIFGRKMRMQSYKGKDRNLEIIICGNESQPIKVKTISSNNQMQYLEGEERFEIETRFVQTFQKSEIDSPEPPIGYQWIWKDKKKIKIDMQLIDSDCKSQINCIKFLVEGNLIDVFDGSSLLVPLQIKETSPMNNQIQQFIYQTLYYPNSEYQISSYDLMLQLRALHTLRYKQKDERVFDVQHLMQQCKTINSVVWKHVLVKFFTDDDINIGPVDRTGNKLQNSISYQYEGTIWRICNLLSALYPMALKISGNYKFKVLRKSSDYLQLISLLKTLSVDRINDISQGNILLQNSKPLQCSIKTALWEHQKYTVEKITDGFINWGKLGFGDASCVGAGKTLTALSVITNLLQHNLKNAQQSVSYKGFLILIPVKQLFNTWQTEIIKHTKGFELIIQNADGSYTPQIQKSSIRQNTIILTTLARIREHPIYISWQLVVIDECLAVQHREALQTQEAWRQVVCSQYGVLMMSATFFRSRFDQLFYMLKMLQSGLPEQKEYLDSILNESMVCYINEKSRKWITTVHKFQLNEELRKKYDQIKIESSASSEKLYNLLADFLYKQYSIVKDVKALLKKLEEEQCRVLIYARSKEEADQFSQNLQNVTRYPDKSGKHVVVSYSEGTYGLNDLIIYDTILTRPPEPDKLPQMKGRLDRPGQVKDVLRLEYMLVGETIEEAWLFRLEVAKKFLNDYILPLSKFFDIAVGRTIPSNNSNQIQI